MRIVDIAVAAAYALLCVSVLSFMNPYANESQSAQVRENSAASSAIFSYVNSVGLPFLASSRLSQFCSSLASASNATLVLSGEISGNQCGSAPSAFEGESALGFAVAGRQVEIEAWVIEEA